MTEDSGFDNSSVKALIDHVQKQADTASGIPQLKPNPLVNVAPQVMEKLKKQPGLRNMTNGEMEAYARTQMKGIVPKGGDAVEKPAVG